MTVFGLTISRTKAAVSSTTEGLSSLSTRGFFPLIREALTGAWQRNMALSVVDLLSCGPVWSCVTLIASDIAKMPLGLTQDTGDGIWMATTNTAYSPVLRRPNHYQNRIAFIQSWLISKLVWGNTYALKRRDGSNKVSALYVLDPNRVKVLVAPDGSVYYELSQDPLSSVGETVVRVPASEVIHDVMITLYHPLCGISPLYACGMAATLGLKIRRNSSTFFDNHSSIQGVLVAPNAISEATQKRLEEHWNENYSGERNAGKIAALGDGLKFEPMQATARDSQLTDQLNDSAIEVCNAFHVPAYMAGYGEAPNYNNAETLNQQYYSQCLQVLIESLELCLDEGLALPNNIGVEFDIDGLIRMDSTTKMKVVTDGVRGGVYMPNEGRKKFNLPPVKGGDAIYMQEQDHSLEWLQRRDALPVEPPAPPIPPPADDDVDEPPMPAKDLRALLSKALDERLMRAA